MKPISHVSLRRGLRIISLGLALACIGQAYAAAAVRAQNPSGQGGIRRHCLAIGSNFGGKSRDTLLYAGSDAATFSRVLEEMGGVRREDTRFLDDPSPEDLDRALADLRDRLLAERRLVESRGGGSGRTEVILYYSGHADARGLLLGESGFDYDRFRRKIDSIPADVRIAVLDACASGAITRLKGGRHRPAFTVDASSDMRGYAFLTSSSPEEASQESDQIGSSFFTHYLVSGLRGAADVSGDGKVTLGEAYQFAFHETLARTERTKGGAQHPAYDMKLSGTGDVVMTDMRATTAGLVLGKDLEGRFYIRNPKGELVAELYKPRSRSMELGLPPGAYSIRLEQPRSLDTASVTLSEGGRETLVLSRFQRMPREATVFRGGQSGGNPGDTLGDSGAAVAEGAGSAGAASAASPTSGPAPAFGFEYNDQVDMRAGMDPQAQAVLGIAPQPPIAALPRPAAGPFLQSCFHDPVGRAIVRVRQHGHGLHPGRAGRRILQSGRRRHPGLPGLVHPQRGVRRDRRARFRLGQHQQRGPERRAGSGRVQRRPQGPGRPGSRGGQLRFRIRAGRPGFGRVERSGSGAGRPRNRA